MVNKDEVEDIILTQSDVLGINTSYIVTTDNHIHISRDKKIRISNIIDIEMVEKETENLLPKAMILFNGFMGGIIGYVSGSQIFPIIMFAVLGTLMGKLVVVIAGNPPFGRFCIKTNENEYYFSVQSATDAALLYASVYKGSDIGKDIDKVLDS